jgi:hypothetical protein
MPQIINTNIASLNAQRNLNLSQNSLAVATQRLSSGLRVNSAKDDAAGMAIAERMYAQARGFSVAIRNANDGISLAQVAEGALAKITDNLQRMRELTVQARNATNSDGDKDSLDKEFGELAKEIQRITQGTTFNGKAILAQAAGSQIFQVGANTTANDVIDFTTRPFDRRTHHGRGRHRQRRIGRAVIGGGTSDRRPGGGHQQHRRRLRLHQRRARHAGRPAEPLRGGDQQSADLAREPDGGAQPHHGRRLRDGDLGPEPRQHPAAGRHRHGGAGQPAAAAGAAVAAWVKSALKFPR